MTLSLLQPLAPIKSAPLSFRVRNDREDPLEGQQAQELIEVMSRILDEPKGIRANIDLVDYTAVETRAWA